MEDIKRTHQYFLNDIADAEPVIYVDAYIEPLKKCFETTILEGPFLFWINKNVKEFAMSAGMKIPRDVRAVFISCADFGAYIGRIVYLNFLRKIKNRTLGIGSSLVRKNKYVYKIYRKIRKR